MQTFIISEYPEEIAKVLDNKRLGKQRIEAISIANILLGCTNSKGWKNHPAVLMWKGYEAFLIKEYLREILYEWMNRGFKNEKCLEHYKRLFMIVKDWKLITPHWFNKKFFDSHKSNLIRKNSQHYRKYWSDIPDDLEYVWPVNKNY